MEGKNYLADFQNKKKRTRLVRLPGNVRSLHFIILVLFFWFLSCVKEETDDSELSPTVILISMDGFRWDYQDKTSTPNLDYLVENGVRSESFIPVFPSSTFPNHLSIVTGCYPENHGIISNSMYDEEWDAEYYIGENSEPVTESRWYEAEPIWVTAEKQGQVTATFFWPGSEAEINGKRPTYFFEYDGSVPNEDRVQQVLDWIDLPKKSRPVFITLYFSDANSRGHLYGPEAAEMDAVIQELDGYIGMLIEGLDDRDVLDKVNIIITSDHGMTGLSRDRVIFLDDYIDVFSDSIRMIAWTPVAMILPLEDWVDSIYNSLNGVHPNMAVYKKDDIPERLHFSNHRRIPPIICIADEGWSITTHSYFNEHPNAYTGGGHGYDPINRSMHGSFIASGPAFKDGLSVNSFLNIHTYNLIAHILALNPTENDGHFDSVSVMLK